MKPFRNPDDCPESANHRTGPINYVDWVEWAEQLAETHEQVMCPGCDLWVVWIPLNDVTNPKDSATTAREARGA